MAKETGRKTMVLDVKEFYRYIGARIKAVRLMRKMSQDDVAKSLGVTFQQLQKYESGANRIAADKLVTLALVLGVGIPEILGDYYPAWGKATDMGDLRLVSHLRSMPRHLRDGVRKTLREIAARLE
ncbi:MAG: helix-turn-helix domain-containing protein [Rickettsiales bacterium]|jgi:transcriptional regulator with XRE-family HTH domain|nr:helix-turn-helix domain-containing protein [Rickettsiales bacterium]